MRLQARVPGVLAVGANRPLAWMYGRSWCLALPQSSLFFSHSRLAVTKLSRIACASVFSDHGLASRTLLSYSYWRPSAKLHAAAGRGQIPYHMVGSLQ